MKYVIFKNIDNDCDMHHYVPIIFHEFINHIDVKLPGYIPDSAGFVSFDDNGINVYGESVSLNLKSTEHDKDILTLMLCGSSVLHIE